MTIGDAMTHEQEALRTKAIEAMADAILAASPACSTHSALILGAAAFYALHGIAAVTPPFLTGAMWGTWCDDHERGHTREEIFRAVIAIGDLTRGPE